jgi:hypothetical protein
MPSFFAILRRLFHFFDAFSFAITPPLLMPTLRHAMLPCAMSRCAARMRECYRRVPHAQRAEQADAERERAKTREARRAAGFDSDAFDCRY